MSREMPPRATSLDRVAMTCFVVAFVFAFFAVVSAFFWFVLWAPALLAPAGRCALAAIAFGVLACVFSWADYWRERRRSGP